ncbi:hypothetical protein HMSSN036_79890 [Paenibacillus macerans]|nr:hypothetical protein HMSSN036_79890 [Paenibacillus macerans]
MNNIVTHLFILLYRVSRRNLIVADQMMPRYPEPLYQKIAREVADWIAGEYAISLPQDEVEYLALHLSGKTIVQHIGDEEKAELRAGMSRILQRLDEEFLTDFNRDEELREALLMHMFPLLNRLYYNLQLKIRWWKTCTANTPTSSSFRSGSRKLSRRNTASKCPGTRRVTWPFISLPIWSG